MTGLSSAGVCGGGSGGGNNNDNRNNNSNNNGVASCNLVEREREIIVLQSWGKHIHFPLCHHFLRHD